MQNITNEQRVNNNEHSISNNPTSSCMEINNNNLPLSSMDIQESKKGQMDNFGCGINSLHNEQNGENDIQDDSLKNKNENFDVQLIEKICNSLHEKAKLNTDELLDEINLSEEEDIPKKITENEYKNEMGKINEYYDELADGSMSKYTGTKNEKEILVNIPIVPELKENTEFISIGKIEAIFEEDKILLKPNLELGVLDLDNVFWNSNHIAIGYLDDVIGKISEPVYIIKLFPNVIDKNIVNISDELFSVKDYFTRINNKEILKKKGCDASNAFDEELSDSDKEFSDDEKEYEYKQMKKKKKNNFKKMRFEDTQENDFVIKSEPLMKEINSLKMKHFSEAPHNDNNGNNFYGNNCINNASNSNNFNTGIFGNNFNKQYPENPYYAQEYKINNNSQMNNNNFNAANNNMSFNMNAAYNYNNSNANNFNNPNPNNFPGNMNPNIPNMNMNMNMGNFNNFGYNSQMNNLSGLIKPMGVNPFNPPNNTSNNNNNNSNNNQNS